MLSYYFTLGKEKKRGIEKYQFSIQKYVPLNYLGVYMPQNVIQLLQRLLPCPVDEKALIYVLSTSGCLQKFHINCLSKHYFFFVFLALTIRKLSIEYSVHNQMN